MTGLICGLILALGSPMVVAWIMVTTLVVNAVYFNWKFVWEEIRALVIYGTIMTGLTYGMIRLIVLFDQSFRNE